MTSLLAAQYDLALAPGFGAAIGKGIGAIVLYAVIGLALMLTGFYAIDLTTPGSLTELVRSGRPNAALVSASGLFSMALIVSMAIFNASGRLGEGTLTALIFGFVGIIVQVLAIRLFERVMRMDMGELLSVETFSPVSVVVAAANISLGLVVAVSIS